MDDEQKRLAEELLATEEEKPGFAKLLYFGQFDREAVLPFPTIPPDQREGTDALLTKVKEFAATEIDPDAIDREREIPDSVIKGLGKLGVLGMTIPTEHGGLGLSQYAYCRAVEEIARRCASTALFINVHQSVGLKAILLFGTDKQCADWLPKLASGESIAAFSLTEPNAGSDAGGVQTRATYDPDKKTYRINGIKQWTTNGSVAKMLTVMAQTDVNGRDAITAFLVTPDMPGFRIRNPSLEKVGMRGTKTANLAFDDLEVPEENILGPKGKGLRVCLTVLDYGRTTFGAICLGAAREATERAITHAKNRYQFKRPLASFPLIKEKIARISAYTYAIDAMTYLTAGLLDKGQEDIMLESAMLKVFSSEALWEILYEAMQIYGGRSFFTDEPFERMMRDARLNMIGEGANEVMHAFIGAVGCREVGLQLKEGLDALKRPFSDGGKAWGLVTGMVGRLRTPSIGLHHDFLQEEEQELAKRIRGFGLLLPRILGKYKEDIVEEQLILDRIAMTATQLCVQSAVLCKLDSDLKNGVAGDNDSAVARYFCKLSCQEIDRLMEAIHHNHDEQLQALSDQLTGV